MGSKPDKVIITMALYNKEKCMHIICTRQMIDYRRYTCKYKRIVQSEAVVASPVSPVSTKLPFQVTKSIFLVILWIIHR